MADVGPPPASPHPPPFSPIPQRYVMRCPPWYSVLGKLCLRFVSYMLAPGQSQITLRALRTGVVEVELNVPSFLSGYLAMMSELWAG